MCLMPRSPRRITKKKETYMYLNKCFIIGNLTRDPELRAMPSGMNVASFSVATNRVYKDRDGKKQEQTEFHNIVVFGRQADTVAQYLKKGSQALIEGRLQTRSWDDKKSGEKKYRTEVVADRVQFGAKPRNAAPQSDDEAAGAPQNEAGSGEEINADDIPF